jgi:glutamyl-tRNA reductase
VDGPDCAGSSGGWRGGALSGADGTFAVGAYRSVRRFIRLDVAVCVASCVYVSGFGDLAPAAVGGSICAALYRGLAVRSADLCAGNTTACSARTRPRACTSYHHGDSGLRGVCAVVHTECHLYFAEPRVAQSPARADVLAIPAAGGAGSNEPQQRVGGAGSVGDWTGARFAVGKEAERIVFGDGPEGAVYIHNYRAVCGIPMARGKTDLAGPTGGQVLRVELRAGSFQLHAGEPLYDGIPQVFLMTRSVQAEGCDVTLVGCNHRSASVSVRERIAFTSEQALYAADELCMKGIVEEAIVLSTCNRSEVYGVASERNSDTPAALEGFFTAFHGLTPRDMSGLLYRHTGGDAVEHLFRVAAGLDSMMLGEAEILGQVRDAYSKALEHGTTGPVLNRLFQSALEIGKRVRTETELGMRAMSVASAGVKLAESVFGDLKGNRALILGAGEVAEQVIGCLRQRGIGEMRIVNRSLARAEELAARYGASSAGWDTLEEQLSWPDVMVTSVSGSGAVLDREQLEKAMADRQGRAIFIVDLGVPRNVQSGAAEVYNLYLYNLDDLDEIVSRNRSAREAEIPRAEALVQEQIRKFDAWKSNIAAVKVIEDLRQQMHEERQEFLRAQRQLWENLSGAEQERMERLSAELVERLLKGPAGKLRRARSLRERIEKAEILRELFGGENPE